MKGSCHIWIDGEGEGANANATDYVMWNSEDAPAVSGVSPVYYLLADCPAINARAKAGEMWQYNGTAWVEFFGDVYVK